MENPCLEQFISSLAQSLNPGCPELINRLSLVECNEEINSLFSNKCDAQTASDRSLLKCLLLIFHRQTTLALQDNAALGKEVESLRAQNASLLHEVQMANKKAMRYLHDLHSAELDLCSHKEELFRLRSEHLAPQQSYSQCDSGFSDSHSSLDERSAPPPLSKWEFFPPEPVSLGIKSAPQPPPTDRGNSDLTSHVSDADIEETCSLSSARFPVPCPSQTQIFDTRVQGKRGVENLSAPAFESQRPAARELHLFRNANLVLPSQERASDCSRFELLEFLAKDIALFDPDNCDQHIDDYFRELDNCLVDLPHATEREKIKLLWKTSSKAVHKFIQCQPPRVRNDFSNIRQALTEEFSSPADEIDCMVAALQIKHSRLENPRDYYKRLRYVYFQGKNAPGLEENPTFKSLFLRNLHPCVRTHVVLMTFKGIPSMLELRKLTQVAWETAVTPKAKGIPTEPASSNPAVSQRSSAPRHHPHNSSKGGVKRQQGDKKRSRYVPPLRRDGHSQNRSCIRPYSEILAQNFDLPVDQSDDERSISDISDHSSEYGQNLSDSDSASDCLSASGYLERCSPEPRAKHRRFRARSSCSPPLY